MLIQTHVSGFGQVEHAVNRLMNLSTVQLARALGETVQRQTRRRIASTKTSPDGKKWAPLKPSTVARKGNANIMIHTGKFLGSIGMVSSTHHAEVGSSIFYAKFHHSGTRKMPQRDAIGLGAQDISECQKICIQFMQRMVS